MRNLDGMVGDRRKSLELEWMRARQPMYEPKAAPGGFREARGAVLFPPHAPKPEEIIRRMRDAQ